MYLHLNFHEATLREYFPSELGEIEVKFQSENKISKNFYFIDDAPLFDVKTNVALINNIQNINLLIGTNNSGKSRFLRSLFKINNPFVSKGDVSAIDLYHKLIDNTVIGKKISYADKTGEDIQKFLGKNMNEYRNINFSDVSKGKLNLIKVQYEQKLKDANDYNFETKDRLKDCITAIDEIFHFYTEYEINDKHAAKHKFYIPILRTLISDDNLDRLVYSHIIKNKFGLADDVFTGLSLYQEIFDLHNSAKRIHELKAFCKWIKNNFYKDNTEVDLMSDTETKNVSLKIDGNFYPIFNIGDGIQQLILLMFPIYTSVDNTWFFIEEPETHLHPGLQRIFIETLLNDVYLKSKNLKFFFTTHSNHFLDISINHDEISIFQFEKENDEKFNIKSNVKPNKEVLDLLGVNSSSVFLANASIWVEEPTDRKYISKWLKLYCEYNKVNYLREDIDFAFFEYGGNLIEHYLFDEDFEEDLNENQVREKIKSFSLSNKVYLLADNDNVEPGSAKQKRREKLQNIKGSNFHYQNTEYKEIENLLPVKILNDFLPQLVNNLDASKIDEINFSREDYYQIGLGEFISDLFRKNKIKGKSFKSKTGDTLSSPYKTKLCDFVVNCDYTYSDLIQDNDHLDKIITDLYNFIKSK